MKFYNVVIRAKKSQKEESYGVEAEDFPSAASWSYLKRHVLASHTGEDWHIISLKETRK